jgi:hypothetical protein
MAVADILFIQRNLHLLEITVDKSFSFKSASGSDGTGTTKVDVIDIARIIDAYIAKHGRARSVPKKAKKAASPSSEAQAPAAASAAGSSSEAAPAVAAGSSAAGEAAPAAAEDEEEVEREAAPESDEDSETEAAARYISRVQALLDSVHIDINNEGVNEEDIGMEVQMDEEEAAMKAADEMIEGFWRD